MFETTMYGLYYTSCYRYIMSDGLFSENKFGQARNQSTPCALSSCHGTLTDPQSISRERKAVAFNTQESIILTISIDFGSGNRISLAELPKEIRKQTKILAVLIRNLLGASVNYMLDNLMHVIRYCIATYGREVDLQVSIELHKAKWSAIVDGYYTLKDRLYYVIYAFDLWVPTVQYIAHTLAQLEDSWFSFVDVVTIHVDELSVFVHSLSTFYRLPIERSMDHHRWNLIRSTATSTELAIEDHQLKGALTNIQITIVLSALANAVTGFIITMSLLFFLKLTTTRNSFQPSRRVSCNDLIIQYTADNTGSVENDTVNTDNIDTEETETFVTPMLTPRNSTSSSGVEFRSRMKVFLKKSVSEGCISHLMGSTDDTGYDSDYMLDRCLSERDVTRSKYGKDVQRSIITPSYITSLLRDDDVINASAMSRNETRSTYTSDDYDSSLTSTDFSSHMLSTSSASSDSLTSSSTASSISLPSSTVVISEATLATGDAADIQLDEPTPAVSECIAEIGNGIAETVNIEIPVNHRDLHTEITEQLTGTGNLPNGLFYLNLEEALLFLSLTFLKNQFFN